MEVLNLNVTKNWFDMIESGIKPEEYREIKEYWTKRLMSSDGQFKQFDIVRFMNGMATDAPVTVREFKGIRIDIGKKEWGAKESILYYVISLGEKISEEKIEDPAQLNLFL